MANIQDTDDQPNAGQDEEQQELCPSAGGNRKSYSHPGRLGVSYKTQQTLYHVTQQLHAWVFTQRI